MKTHYLLIALAALIGSPDMASAHCQMPCGIYHDEMVFDEIDQYVETMYKAMGVLNDNHFETVKEKNEFIRWVGEKEKESCDTANLITKFFLQQKIKPGEPDTAKKIESAHKMLFELMLIKQNTDKKFVDTFSEEWDRFKLMFHVENYACRIETIKRQRAEEKKAETEKANDTKPAAPAASAAPAVPDSIKSPQRK